MNYEREYEKQLKRADEWRHRAQQLDAAFVTYRAEVEVELERLRQETRIKDQTLMVVALPIPRMEVQHGHAD